MREPGVRYLRQGLDIEEHCTYPRSVSYRAVRVPKGNSNRKGFCRSSVIALVCTHYDCFMGSIMAMRLRGRTVRTIPSSWRTDSFIVAVMQLQPFWKFCYSAGGYAQSGNIREIQLTSELRFLLLSTSVQGCNYLGHVDSSLAWREASRRGPAGSLQSVDCPQTWSRPSLYPPVNNHPCRCGLTLRGQ